LVGGGVWGGGDFCGFSRIFAGFSFYLRVSGYICEFSFLFAGFGFYLRVSVFICALEHMAAIKLLFAAFSLRAAHLTAAPLSPQKTKRAPKPGLPPTLHGY
jgi:hypothetical protein